MVRSSFNRRSSLRVAAAALALALGTVSAAAPAFAQATPGHYKPSRQLLLNVGEGEMVNLPRSVVNVWTSNPDVADVYVSSSKQINVFGKTFGQATVIATAADGSVVYGANVAVNQNSSSINDAIHQALPDSNIGVTQIGQLAVINGTVASPDDASQAELLVKAMLNAGVKDGDAPRVAVVNRLKTATPLQVMLRVRIAEMNRSALKQIGVNLLNRDSGSGHLFGIGQGDPGTINVAEGPADPVTGVKPQTVTGATFNNIIGGTTLGLFGHILGTDLLGTLDLLQKDGLVTTLAEPNLTALSGETANFLAGGEFPIPVSQSLGAVTIEYKQYGVGLAFTPIVLSDGRISMRVRPEVSELSNEGSVVLNNFKVPALTTRRAETTVELGSGQSFMIAGLLRKHDTNDVSKAPFLGDLPVLGALFRSTAYRRDETEMVVIVTPYLVRPVSGQIPLPTDGYRMPDDGSAVFGGQTFSGVSGARTPTAYQAAPTTIVAPGGPVAAPGFKL